jgi:hypothetical protein
MNDSAWSLSSRPAVLPSPASSASMTVSCQAAGVTRSSFPLTDLADARATVGQRLDQPKRFQLAQRLADWSLARIESLVKGRNLTTVTIYRSFVPHRKRKRLGSSTSLSGKKDGRQTIMSGNQICGDSFS